MSQHATGEFAPLDTTVLVATPENVAFDFRIAGPFSRALALLVDLAIIGALMLAFAISLGLLGGSGIGLLLFIGFAIWWGYGACLEAFNNGQTFGKKAIGIRVVSESGLSINASQAFLRNILRSADLFPPFYPGVAAMLFGSRMQRIGDFAAGTMVVIAGDRVLPHPPNVNRMNDQIRQLIPVSYRPDQNVLEALAAYIGRRGELSPPRRRELSSILARHFIRVWSLPAKMDPDLILCSIYEHSTSSGETDALRSQRIARRRGQAEVLELTDFVAEDRS